MFLNAALYEMAKMSQAKQCWKCWGPVKISMINAHLFSICSRNISIGQVLQVINLFVSQFFFAYYIQFCHAMNYGTVQTLINVMAGGEEHFLLKDLLAPYEIVAKKPTSPSPFP